MLVNTSVILQRIDRRSTSLRISLFFFFPFSSLVIKKLKEEHERDALSKENANLLYNCTLH